MYRKWVCLLIVVLVLGLAGMASAEEGLIGEYYHGSSSDAWDDLVMVRLDPTVDFNWGDPGSPEPGVVNVDNFKARWTGEVEIPSTGTWTFHTQTDDGVRLWVNDVLVLENWTDHGSTHDAGEINLKGGQLFNNLCQEIDNFMGENHEHPVLRACMDELKSSKEKIIEMAGAFRIKGQEDPGLPLCVAKPFMDATGHVLITWMLLKSAVVADSFLGNPDISETDRAFYQGKIHTSQFAVANFLPEVHAVAKTVSSWDRSILDIDDASF